MIDRILNMVNGDGLSEALSHVFEAQAAPLFIQVRDQLLKRITGTPPPSFRDRLAARGVSVTEEDAQALWGALVGALADAPAMATVDTTGLHVPDPGAGVVTDEVTC